MDVISDFYHLFETNTGMVLFSRTDNTRQFLRAIHQEHAAGSDQHYFHLYERVRGQVQRRERHHKLTHHPHMILI